MGWSCCHPGSGSDQPPSSMIIWPPGSTWPIPTAFTPSDRRPSPWGGGNSRIMWGSLYGPLPGCSSPAQALCSLPGWGTKAH